MGKCAIKILVAVYAKRCYAYKMQVYTGLFDGAREKKQGLRFVKYMVCHMYGTRRGDTTVDFCTSFERLNFLLTKNATWVVTLTKNELESSALFLSGKQRQVNSSTGIFGFTNELKRIHYIQHESRLSFSFHQTFMKTNT